MNYRNDIMKYVQQELAKGRGATLQETDDLLAGGIIDSLGILMLVGFVEERFGIAVPDEDVVYENFCSVAALADYLEQQ